MAAAAETPAPAAGSQPANPATKLLLDAALPEQIRLHTSVAPDPFGSAGPVLLSDKGLHDEQKMGFVSASGIFTVPTNSTGQSLVFRLAVHGPTGVRIVFSGKSGSFSYRTSLSAEGRWCDVAVPLAIIAERLGKGATVDDITLFQKDPSHKGMLYLQHAMLTTGQIEAPAAISKPAAQSAPELLLDLGSNVTMRLLLIPAGKFVMGSPESEKDRFPDEGPPREVAITKPFYLGVHAVTQAQFEQVMGANPSKTKGAQNPADSVLWDDAAEFCKKLSAQTGRTVRLPTEAEWEYACRAGTTNRFSFGEDESRQPDYGWSYVNGGHKTHPVGQKKANPWGLYDMHGNVWEWCADWYTGSYARASQQDPQGPAYGPGHVMRGNCYNYGPADGRSAFRAWGAPGQRCGFFGFRVVVEAN